MTRAQHAVARFGARLGSDGPVARHRFLAAVSGRDLPRNALQQQHVVPGLLLRRCDGPLEDNHDMRSSLNYGGTIARNDGSGCIVLTPGSLPIDIYPSVMACTDASGTFLWRKSIYPVGQPRATELADGTLVIGDVRTPEVMGLKPNGDKRFEIVPCLSNPTTDRIPFYKTSGVARNASGGAVAQIGDDVLVFRGRPDSVANAHAARRQRAARRCRRHGLRDVERARVRGRAGRGWSRALDTAGRRERKSHRPGRRRTIYVLSYGSNSLYALSACARTAPSRGRSRRRRPTGFLRPAAISMAGARLRSIA